MTKTQMEKLSIGELKKIQIKKNEEIENAKKLIIDIGEIIEKSSKIATLKDLLKIWGIREHEEVNLVKLNSKTYMFECCFIDRYGDLEIRGLSVLKLSEMLPVNITFIECAKVLSDMIIEVLGRDDLRL